MAKPSRRNADDWDDSAPAATATATVVAAGGAKPAESVEPAPAAPAKPDPRCDLPSCVVPADAMRRQFLHVETALDERTIARLSRQHPAVRRLAQERDELKAKLAAKGGT